MSTRKLPIGIQDFEKLREDGYVYADKTAIIYNLVQTSSPYFLSRPRRFGKSLLITTLEAYFMGKKELFHGLAIEKLEKDWIEYPVLKFSLAGGEFTTTENGLRKSLAYSLSRFEEKYGLKQKDDWAVSERFRENLFEANEKTGRRVAVLVDEYDAKVRVKFHDRGVVLVDEYDNPLLKNIGGSTEQDEKYRALYKVFFAVLKDCDTYLRFVLFTGVTKFSKVSIFSDLNQLQDISMDNEFSEICGITQSELETTFSPEINEMAEANNTTREECLEKLKRFYDGYHFSKKSANIYNPFSLINAFKKREFGMFQGWPWMPIFSTFLAKRLNEMGFDLRQFSDGSLYASEDEITDYSPDNPDIVPLLYQSGYLTLKEYDERYESFSLAYPNEEVKYGFTQSLTPVYLNSDKPLDVRNFCRDIDMANTDSLRDRFTALFANLPYPANPNDSVLERDFQNVVYLEFLLLGQFVKVEQHSAKGRADCIVETEEYVYIFEFKRDGTAEEALSQIDSQGYAKPYEADSRKLIKIGAVFSSEERTLSDWLVGE